MDTREYEKTWPGLPIKYLILSCKDYIVFLDHENDLDWATTDGFETRKISIEEKKGYYSAKNEIDSAESSPVSHLDEKVIICYKRQLGEALIRAFEGDYENAKKMVVLAKEYIFKRSVEQSRFLFLVSCGYTTSIALAILIFFWLMRDFLIPSFGSTVFYTIVSALMGSFGALLSVILRMGKLSLDFNASKQLHYLEGSSRIIAGVISALIITLCIQTGILLPTFGKIQTIHVAMILGGLIAGASERFAPSIINKLDGLTNYNEK